MDTLKLFLACIKIENLRSVIPAYSFSADVGTSISSVHLAPLVDWAFVTEPQSAMADQVYHYPRGRCLGGR